MNKVNVEKVIDYTKVLKDNEILQDMDKILRNENINLKLEIERLNNIIEKIRNYVYKSIDKEWDDILCIIEDGLKGSESNE